MRYMLLLLLFISGCKPGTTADSIQGTPSDSTANRAEEVNDRVGGESAEGIPAIGEMIQIENDDIGAYPFTQDFDALVSSLPHARISRRPFQNLHDSTRTDTLVGVTFGPSSIEYYKIQADGSGFILDASIQSDEPLFKKGIRIGMSQDDFISLFDELRGKEGFNTVIISTMEGLNQSVFVFEGGRLATVRYESYFD